MASRNPFAAVFSSYNFDIALLEPSKSPDDPIAVRLEGRTKTDVPYECVSYDRSKDYGSSNITLNGEQIEIPQPLEEALRVLRKPDEPRYLWADVLLGRNLQQQNEQAVLAKQILQNAKATVIWLGPGSDLTADAFKLARTLAAWWLQGAAKCDFPSNFARATMAQMSGMMSYIQSQNAFELQPENKELWEALLAIFQSNYFASVQSISDIILSTEIRLISGSSSIVWTDFLAAFRCLVTAMPRLLERMPPPELLKSFSRVGGIEIADRRYKEGQGLELHPMIQTAGEGRTADPRDFVFAMLPIVEPSKRQEITGHKVSVPVADYSKTTEEVFTEAAAFIIEERQDLLLWWAERPPCSRRLKGMPSWVPDWTTGLPPNVIKINAERTPSLRQWSDSVTSRRDPPKPITITDNKLRLHVHELDRVRSVSRIFTQENCRRMLLQQFQSLPPIPGQSLEDKVHKYWRTLVLNTGGAKTTLREDKPPPDNLWISFQSVIAEERILELLGCTMEQLASDPAIQERAKTHPDCQLLGPQCGKGQEFEALLRTNAVGRRFFTTENGRTGMTAFEEPYVEEGEAGQRAAELAAALNQMPVESDFPGVVDNMMAGFQNFLRERDPQAGAAYADLMRKREEAVGVKVGDVIVAAVGGFHPYVLRPVDDSASDTTGSINGKEFKFVGDCYLHGVMAGECFSVKGWFGSISWKPDIQVVEVKVV